jgi:hypothetical protein
MWLNYLISLFLPESKTDDLKWLLGKSPLITGRAKIGTASNNHTYPASNHKFSDSKSS